MSANITMSPEAALQIAQLVEHHRDIDTPAIHAALPPGPARRFALKGLLEGIYYQCSKIVDPEGEIDDYIGIGKEAIELSNKFYEDEQYKYD